MTTSNGTPVEKASLRLRQATSWAENIVHTAINMQAADRLSGAALRLWETAVPLFEGGPTASPDHRQAVKLCLDALIMQPEVLAWVAREARDHLMQMEAAEDTPMRRVCRVIDETLAREGVVTTETELEQAPLAANVRDTLSAIADKLPETLHVPLAVNHTIDGVICELRPDGALELSSTALGLVRMEPRDAYALGMFLRSPAAVALLEAQNAARMTEGELSYQDDQAEEAVRLAAR